MTVRRRKLKKPVVSKSAQLEEKIDGLVSLLKAGAQSGAIAADTQASAAIYDSAHSSDVGTNDKTSPHSQTEGGSATNVLDDYLPNLPVLTPGTTGSEGTSCNSPASVLHEAVEPSPVEAEEYLTTLQTHKSKYFPFLLYPIHYPCSATASRKTLFVALHNDNSFKINVTATSTL